MNLKHGLLSKHLTENAPESRDASSDSNPEA